MIDEGPQSFHPTLNTPVHKKSSRFLARDFFVHQISSEIVTKHILGIFTGHLKFQLYPGLIVHPEESVFISLKGRCICKISKADSLPVKFILKLQKTVDGSLICRIRGSEDDNVTQRTIRTIM